MRKYVLDTNVYINAIRTRSHALELERFFASFAPSIYLSSVVLHELLAGTSSLEKAAEIEASIVRPLKRAKRLFTPVHRTWEAAGNVLARMSREEGLEVGRVRKSFVHDVLIAISCRENGIILITDDTSDFKRIRRYIRFEFVHTWPK